MLERLLSSSVVLAGLLTLQQPARDQVLLSELRAIAASTTGTLGVRVVQVESGRGASLNGDDWFPMMSVYKLPIAIHTLRLAERATLDLDERVTLTADDRRSGSSPLAQTIALKGPQALTIRELLSSVIRISDNTASDRLLRIAGGPPAVQQTLTALRVHGVNVNRYELEFAADYYGICCVGKVTPFSLERFIGQIEAVRPAERRKAAAAFLGDRRDSATPDGLAELMVRLTRGEILNPANTSWLLDEMAEMHTRDTRLRAGLPPGTRASLRPGTSGETDGIRAAHHDTAIVRLPDGRGHVVIVTFLKGSKGPDATRDRVLARVGHTAYQWGVSADGPRH